MTLATAHPATYGLDASFPRFSVAKYQRMIASGVLTPEDKVELLENYMVLKMPSNPPHAGTILRLGKRLGRLLPPGWDLRVQSPVVLPDSQPDPDLAVVRQDPGDYTARHPEPADVGLLVEVADSSLVRDQRDKTRIYARAQITQYWIVNLVDRTVEVYSDPSGPGAAPAYRTLQVYQASDAVPLVLGGGAVAAVPVVDLLP